MDLKNNKVWTVSELSRHIRLTLEENFSKIYLKGEVSSISAKGHIYFSLQDEETQIDCICWNSQLAKIDSQIEKDKKYIIEGKITTYEQRSKYQVIVQNAFLDKEGEAKQKLQELKTKLQEKGYFDTANKQEIPRLATHIGLITSKEGAVMHDIIDKISSRRMLKITLYNAIMQGENCPKSVIAGLKKLHKMKNKPEIIIIARGGGAEEDLYIFNNEDIANMVFKSTIPIISAIGHESDFTILDLVADKRASTPTSAAEMVTSITSEYLKEKITLYKNRLKTIMKQKYESFLKDLSIYTMKINQVLKQKFNLLEHVLHKFEQKIISPQATLDTKLIKLKNMEKILFIYYSNNLKNRGDFLQKIDIKNSYLTYLNQQKEKIISLTKDLNNLSYHGILEKGFALPYDKSNKIVKSVGSFKSGSSYFLQLKDGKIKFKPEGK